MTVVLLDALGTLLELERPWPHLVRELGQRGTHITAEQAREAMRAEMAFYRSEHHRGDAPGGLASLRRACADVVLAHLGPAGAEARIEDVEAALLAAVRFRAYPDAAPALEALRADGAQLVVVSNWDVSLHLVLERTGLAGLLDGAISSAEAGAAKPEPAIFAQALALVDGSAADACMVGDSVETDIAGARAAGVAPVLVVRGAGDGLGSFGAAPEPPEGVTTVASLAELPGVVRYLR